MRASDTVRMRIETEIQSGALRPGDAVDERSLSERFHVSRTPAREAIMQLAASGLVRMSPRRGAVVTEISAEEAINMMESLVSLEAEATMLAAGRLRDDEIEELERIHAEGEEAARARDSGAYMAYNSRFHELIYVGSRNAYLAGLIRQARLRMTFYHRSSLTQAARVAASWEEHGAVLAAFRDGDVAVAGKRMRDHILSGGRVYADLVAALTEAGREGGAERTEQVG
ncbi:MAG: GntR family transcriptional regulator [Paracoccaceae bacterium]